MRLYVAVHTMCCGRRRKGPGLSDPEGRLPWGIVGCMRSTRVLRGARLVVSMNPGDIVGNKYRLTRRLGVGAMGVVWEALNEKTGRKVALKLILHPTDELR